MKHAIAALLILLSFAACAKPMVDAKIKGDVNYFSRDYAATPNDIYYAVKWALVEGGYPVTTENLSEGLITTAWVPVLSDSHYIEMFGKKDFGVTNSYHQIEVQVVPLDGRTEVKVGSRAKTLVANLHSSGIEEKKILERISKRLRKDEPKVTNLGVEE